MRSERGGLRWHPLVPLTNHTEETSRSLGNGAQETLAKRHSLVRTASRAQDQPCMYPTRPFVTTLPRSGRQMSPRLIHRSNTLIRRLASADPSTLLTPISRQGLCALSPFGSITVFSCAPTR